jgi:hypothetical protein
VSVPIYEVIAGGLLVLFVPGYTIAKAVFPEWRIRGPDPIRTGVVLVTLSFLLSLSLTVVVGFGLLNLSPSGFQAAWSDPQLEVVLAALALIGFSAGWLRGAYARVSPTVRMEPVPGGVEGAWEMERELDRLSGRARRLAHALRVSGTGSPEAPRLKQEIEEVEAQQRELLRRRQAEYAD